LTPFFKAVKIFQEYKYGEEAIFNTRIGSDDNRSSDGSFRWMRDNSVFSGAAAPCLEYSGDSTSRGYAFYNDG